MNHTHLNPDTASNGEESTPLLRKIRDAPSAKKPKSKTLRIREWLEGYAGKGVPLDLLPRECRALIEEASASLGFGVEGGMAFMLPAIAAAIGHGADVELRGGFTECAILWTCVMAEPSSGKTPMLKLIEAPLSAIHRENHQRYLAERQAFEQKTKERDLQEPQQEIAWLGSGTMQGNAKRVANCQGVFGAYDEILSLVKSLNQFARGEGADRSLLLSAWSGICKPTVLSSEVRNSQSLRLSITGGIQRAPFLKLLKADEEDGFLPRLDFIAVSEPEKKYTEISPKTKAAYLKRIKELRKATKGEPRLLTVCREAKALFVAFERECDDLKKSCTSFGRGFIGKLAGKAGRLSLLLALLHHPKTEIIREDSVKAGIRAACWLLLETHQAFIDVDKDFFAGLSARAKSVLDYLKKQGGQASESNIKRNVACFRGNAPGAIESCNELIDAGLAERVEGGGFAQHNKSATIRLFPHACASKSA